MDPVDLGGEARGERVTLKRASDEGGERGHAAGIPGIFSLSAICLAEHALSPWPAVGAEKDARESRSEGRRRRVTFCRAAAICSTKEDACRNGRSSPSVVRVTSRRSSCRSSTGRRTSAAIDISPLLREDGPRHARSGVHEHRLDDERDHLPRRREGHPPLPRHPDRAARREVDLRRDRVPADLRQPADQGGARRSSRRCSRATR